MSHIRELVNSYKDIEFQIRSSCTESINCCISHNTILKILNLIFSINKEVVSPISENKVLSIFAYLLSISVGRKQTQQSSLQKYLKCRVSPFLKLTSVLVLCCSIDNNLDLKISNLLSSSN